MDRDLSNWPSGRHYSTMIEMNLLLFEDEYGSGSGETADDASLLYRKSSPPFSHFFLFSQQKLNQ